MHEVDHTRRCGERWGHPNPDFCIAVHEWIDAPYRTVILSPIHRLWRHDPVTSPAEALELFGPPAHECVIGHILDDATSTQGAFLVATVSALPVLVTMALAGRDARER